MTPFSELYCKYYTLITQILSLAHNHSVELNTLRALISQNGFLESSTSLLPSLISQEEDGYHLLKKDAHGYHSILQNKPINFLTSLEASWLKTLLQDPKIHLFLEDEDYYTLKKALSSVPPLFSLDMLSFARQGNSISYEKDEAYQTLFKKLTAALQNENLLLLSLTKEETDTSLLVAPYKIEYAIREDHFNLLGVVLEKGELSKLRRIPLTHIKEVVTKGCAPSRMVLNTFTQAYKCKEPIYFELNNMRSGFERAFMYLSPYERITEYNEETQTCFVQLYYYPFDEAQLIDMLISFGPIIKILGPKPIKACFKSRIDNQFNLFANFFTR